MADDSQSTRACPTCGGGMTRGTKPTVIEYKGLKSPEFEMPGLYCVDPDCGEGLLSWADMAVGDVHLRRLKQRLGEIEEDQDHA